LISKNISKDINRNISKDINKNFSKKINEVEDKGIGFIGAGKVGTALGVYFRSKGLNIAGYASRNPESAKRAADITASKAFMNLHDLVSACKVIIITVPDGQIANVWKEISPYSLKDKIICHTSGSVTSEVFSGIKDKGAFGLSLHPMYAFADRSGIAEGLENACFTMESFFTDTGNSEITKLRALVDDFISTLGNKVFTISSENKPKYHLANAIASNLVLALLSISCELMAGCGVDESETLEALMPLVNNNIENIRRNGFINSLTGPVERNDKETILKHLKAVPERYRETYRELSARLVELSHIKHREYDYSSLKKLLGV
jgi:predicted short-subunit dehydrogenase-like oxidoreductase (DUF2520 family)